jgi:hypothetical protein
MKTRDALTVIEGLIQEHQAIKGHMKSVSTLAEDWRGMERDNLTNLGHERFQALNNKRFNLKQTICYLDEGLKNHWIHEDHILPQLIGDPLMKSIKIEHEEIEKQMHEINYLMEKSTPQEFLTNRDYLMEIISHLCQLISEHEIKEDTILQLLKRQFI